MPMQSLLKKKLLKAPNMLKPFSPQQVLERFAGIGTAIDRVSTDPKVLILGTADWQSNLVIQRIHQNHFFAETK